MNEVRIMEYGVWRSVHSPRGDGVIWPRFHFKRLVIADFTSSRLSLGSCLASCAQEYRNLSNPSTCTSIAVPFQICHGLHLLGHCPDGILALYACSCLLFLYCPEMP